MSSLDAWANFYVIVGSTAGALTGLQFVVLTLIAQASALRGSRDSIAAFGSPNVVHFCAALLVAAILAAPWHTMAQAGPPVIACGTAGVLYCVAVLRRARRQSGYQPVLEDWVWHNILPTLAYAALLAAGFALQRQLAGALFVIGGAELLLLFIGIHNAWDTVTYVTLEEMSRQEARARAPDPETVDRAAAAAAERMPEAKPGPPAPG
ncbi:MAG TPA: hypothetical protein VI792_01530 [Candidatus Eisenbacteria bacterium]